MTEYWKSQARKYCEFCKCWFADNKVSISFHEGGKRHKENVQKHISQITKKSTKEFKQKEKVDDDLKKMEAAAMAAYLKDVQNNADLTSQSINNMLGESSSKDKNEPVVEVPQPRPRTPPKWQEVKADDGSYFWNKETNETTWDPPDYYLSLADQEKEKLKGEEAKKIKKKQNEQKQKEAIVEAKARAAREHMRALSVKQAPEPAAHATHAQLGPAPRAAKPYGTWKTVETKPEEKIDLQLPKADKEVLPPPVVMEPEARAAFGERRVESLGDGPVEFKKRKFCNPKRNMRQKLDDD